MNRKKEHYDRFAVGERIQKQRIRLRMSQEKLAEQIDRAAKYCSDIERGTCGMSIETMLALSKKLHMSLDYMMFGTEPTKENSETTKKLEDCIDVTAINNLLQDCSERQRSCILQILELLKEGMENKTL